MLFDELLKLVYDSSPEFKVHCDSRAVQPGDIFVAVKGTQLDGHDFIEHALKNGAKYIVAQKYKQKNDPRIILVEDSANAAGLLAQASFKNPAQKLTNLAVTGTNGKTTVAFLVRSAIKNAGQTCGLIGTVFYDTGLAKSDANLTTPDAPAIAKMTSEMLKAGAKYMVIEASSHALSQNRTAAINFKAAAFTNLAGDHLDYHKTQNQYLAAKTLLFRKLDKNAVAILNKQSPQAKEIAKKTTAKILWYAVDQPADIQAHIESMDMTGTIFSLQYKGQKQNVKTPLLGKYNVANHAAAAGLCLAAGLELKTIAKGFSNLKNIPGRLEKINSSADFTVIVDYAHTDDALKNVLETLKPLCKNKLIVVFGCGGDRDKTKRPRMAKVAQNLADLIFVTSDNPRTEDPLEIIDDITKGFDNKNDTKITVEPDRKKAIHLALNTAKKDDILLVAGKGHETYQIIGNQKFDFSDKQIALDYLAEKK